MISLDPTTFPLLGESLIEASAGTGKTYTITSLYLRAILEQRLNVKQILLVTFTEAATEELRDRIGQRVRQALRLFKNGDHESPQHNDALLTTLFHEYGKPDQREDSINRLMLATTTLDEAAIYTIHGFCRRALMDQAFETGIERESELETNIKSKELTVAADVWRQLCHNKNNPELARYAYSTWQTPHSLLADIRSVTTRDGIKFFPPDLDLDIDTAFRNRAAKASELRALWIQQFPHFKESVETAQIDGRINRRIFTKPATPKWLNAANIGMGEWRSPDIELPKAVIDLCQRLNDSEDFNHPLLAHINLYAETDSAMAQIRYWAINAFRAGIENLKTEQRFITHDDLLIRLRDALRTNNGHNIAARIRERYPIAMIDEFQDTDPVQYEIFRHIYIGQPNVGLILIGDPKQAIYSFRGGDIFTYIEAKSAIAARSDAHGGARIYSLDRNFRSSADLLHATEKLFTCFTNNPFDSELIPFHSVHARDPLTPNPLTVANTTAAPLHIWFAADQGKKDEGRQALADWTATEIAQLLKQGRIADHTINPTDIAILVRQSSDVSALQSALRARGIRSSFLSQESVFSAPEAGDLSLILHAILEHTNESAIRNALGTRLMARTWDELSALRDSEATLESTMVLFRQFHAEANGHGIIATIRGVIRRFHLAERWLAAPEGERVLTNVLQLVELLQTASQEIDGLANLLHWLEQSITNADGQNEAQQLRLDSDENIVKIVTIHKSKGLEYPIVFLPWACFGRSPSKKSVITYHADKHHALIADLDPERSGGEDGVSAAAREQRAEDVRLLYVAITRAKYRCYLGLAKSKDFCKTALASLLGLADISKEMALQRLNENLAELAQSSSASDKATIHIRQQAPETSLQQFDIVAAPERQLESRRFVGAIVNDWQVTSYTQLSRQHSDELFAMEVDTEVNSEPEIQSKETTLQSIHTFPAGSWSGQFFHAVLEDVMTNSKQSHAEIICRHLGAYGFSADWRSVLEAWLKTLLETELEVGCTLSKLAATHRIAEMEFLFPATNLNSDALNAIIARINGKKTLGRKLEFDTTSGLVKGFIDLVYQHEGRYFVLDYKSNRLGLTANDYDNDNASLSQAIQEHRYDLQYLLYTLALHRYLKCRMGAAYDYDQHVGGVRYVFLRGIEHPTHGIFRTRISKDVITEMDGLLGAPTNA